MSQNDNHRAKLARLADALMQDIIDSSDAEILAEIDIAHITRGRAIFAEVKARVAKQSLAAAKTQLAAWRSLRSRSTRPIDRNEAREHFEKIRRADSDFDRKMLLAARNGKAPTDNDKEGLIDDLADLKGLEDEGTPE